MKPDRKSNGSTAGSDSKRSDTVDDNDLAGIDLEALAQKVYALMKEELRIERDRLGFSR